MNKAERNQKRAREDKALNRVLLWFGGAVLLELFVLVLNRFYVNFTADGTALAHGLARFLQVLVWVSLALTLAAAVWTVLRHKRGGKTFWPLALTGMGSAVFVCALVAAVWRAVGVQFLYVMVPVVAVLALIFNLYQREFFLVALLGCVGLFALWGYRKLILVQPAAVYVIFSLAAAVTLAFAVGIFLLQRNKGRLPGKHPVTVLGGKANYALLYVACGVNGVGLLAALIFGLSVAYVFLFLVAAWLFAAAVYYTVRLM